jgi:uncharacterized tellurite resistance protein B-like protein
LFFADGIVSLFEETLLWRAADMLGVAARDRIQLKHRIAQDTTQDQTDPTT